MTQTSAARIVLPGNHLLPGGVSDCRSIPPPSGAYSLNRYSVPSQKQRWTHYLGPSAVTAALIPSPLCPAPSTSGVASTSTDIRVPRNSASLKRQSLGAAIVADIFFAADNLKVDLRSLGGAVLLSEMAIRPHRQGAAVCVTKPS